MILISGPPAFSRIFQLLALVALVVLFFQAQCLFQSRANRIGINHAEIAVNGAVPEEQYLDRLTRQIGLSNYTSWTAWRVRVSEQDSEWTSFTNIDADFHSNQPRVVDVREPVRRDLVARQELDVPVPGSPVPGQVDASDFLFAVSTSFEQVVRDDYAVIRDWARWMTGGNQHGNGASFVLVLDQGDGQQVKELDEILHAFGIDAYVTSSVTPASAARRYFNMIEALKGFGAKLTQRGQRKKWYGVLDEKIFLPNLSYLQERLFAYNSEEELYIGLPSERGDWAIGDGFMTTYGGGAVFLTRSAVSRIPQLPCFGDEADDKKSWDSLLQDCLTKHTSMRMHILPSFFTPSANDEYSSHTDSYETGVQPLALHHYEERHHLTPSLAHLVTDVCGEACFLQRYRFRDNWVLVNGYTITEYPDGMSLADMPVSMAGRAAEARRKSVIGPVTVEEDMADRKMLFWTGRRNVWRLMDSATSKEGHVWQAYVKRGAVEEDTTLRKRSDEGAQEAEDSVIVLIWESATSGL
ncbi:hypothetical protein ACJ41O_007977 [Fusarium nematophilum]